MAHHHLAPFVALWTSLLSMAGGAVAIIVAMRDAKRPAAKSFDFAASARRIRTAPVKPRDPAEGV